MIPYAQTPNPNDTVNSTRTQGRIELEHTKQSFDLLRTGLNLAFLLRLEQGNIHAPNKTPANRTWQVYQSDLLWLANTWLSSLQCKDLMVKPAIKRQHRNLYVALTWNVIATANPQPSYA